MRAYEEHKMIMKTIEKEFTLKMSELNSLNVDYQTNAKIAHHNKLEKELAEELRYVFKKHLLELQIETRKGWRSSNHLADK